MLFLVYACASESPAPTPAPPAPTPAPPASDEEAAPAGSISGDPILEAPIVIGALETGAIRAVLDTAREALDACYAAGVAGDPALAGKVLVRFVIGADGRVASARVKASSLWNEPAEACLVRTVEGLQFPRPPADGTAVVSWPFEFGPAVAATTPRSPGR